VNVVRAKVLGFCMGVRRAVDLTSMEARKGTGKVYTLGPLIHNPRVLAELKEIGAPSVNSLDEIKKLNKNCSVVIRAHGVKPSTEIELHNIGAYVVDATCPNVKASQLKAEELARAGYCLFLAGEANHAEIEGIIGYAHSGGLSADLYSCFCEAVSNAAEAGKAAKKLYGINSNAKTALIGQTTISEKEYLAISEAVRMFFPNLEVINAICLATKERQDALRDLLDLVDGVIIAGGKESANTRRLFAIAKESGKPSVLIEDASEISIELSKEFLKLKTIGLCAGASTPDSVIDEIETKLAAIG